MQQQQIKKFKTETEYKHALVSANSFRYTF